MMTGDGRRIQAYQVDETPGEHALIESATCGFRSSVSAAVCILPVGHPADSATRFHRFPRRGRGITTDRGTGEGAGGGGMRKTPDSPDHTVAPGMWSYTCKCLRCAWEQWWNEADSDVIPMPDQPHPDGDFANYWENREFWRSHGHHPRD